jgi:hypothetical protein
MSTKNTKTYVPVTPGGSVLMHLESKTRKKAWKRLMKEAAHMPYQNQKEFEKRGYEVCSCEKA